MNRKSAALVMVVLLSLLLGGCSSIDKATETLNNAINRLDQTSAAWSDVLTETRDRLIEQGQSTLAVEVGNVLTRTVQAVGVEARCYTDFLRDRVREDLVQIRAAWTKETVSLVPVFCKPSPDSIDLNVPPERRPLVIIDGYNLSKESIHARLERADGTSVNVDDTIDVFGYQATVNVGRLPLTRTTTRLVFTLGAGTAATQSLPVVQAVEKPVYSLATVHVHGTVYLDDVEDIGSNEHRDVVINTYVTVPAAGAELHWGGDGTGCVGDEVNGYLDVYLVIDPDNGAVTVTGTSRYYEGQDCGPTKIRRTGSVSFPRAIAVNTTATFAQTLSDSNGGVRYDVRFTNDNAEQAAALDR